MTDEGPAVYVRGLVKRFGSVTAVDHLDLDIPRRQIHGFLGPNGSGKSTTMRMLCGLMDPTAGQIRVLGHEIPREAESLKRSVGYMTQKFSLWEDLTARENLTFMARIFTLPPPRARQRIEAVTAEFRLAEFFDRPAGSLSGGQKQRLALAAATLHEPPLLMLDEPTSAVDPQSRRDFWESLFALVARGATILVSTHYMDEAERCHGLSILDCGRLVAHGSPQQLMRDLPLEVVEVEARDIEGARAALHELPRLASLAQLGLRIHALIEPGEDALASVRKALDARGIDAQVKVTGATLEDVFVGATLKSPAAPPASDARPSRDARP